MQLPPNHLVVRYNSERFIFFVLAYPIHLGKEVVKWLSLTLKS